MEVEFGVEFGVEYGGWSMGMQYEVCINHCSRREYAVWSMVWSMEYGVWRMEYGVWSMYQPLLSE